MKRSELARKTPMRSGKGFKPAASTLKRSGKLAPRSNKNSDPRPKTGEAALCKGQPCYLRIPGIEQHDPGTVVPCHSNQLAHGKARGMKAHDKFTVPGCWLCHRELDQGARFTRAEKFALWDDAYARWAPVRDGLL